jgi:DNA-binding SARP family transcriptional activator
VLHIRLFGSMSVITPDGRTPVKIAHNEKLLLAYLLLWPGRAHTRDVLMDLCWGDQAEEQAKACLNTTLWRLRRSLDSANRTSSPYVLTQQDGSIGFNWNCEYRLDCKTFDECAKSFLGLAHGAVQQRDADAIEAALPLYCGHLLDGFYEDWALRERERLHLVHVECLLRLMQYYEHCGEYERSVEFGQRVLHHDSLREDVHRALMRLYAQTGRRAQAVQQYETCRKLLAADLDITPMPETELLHAAIVAGTDVAKGHAVNGAKLAHRNPTAAEFDEIVRQLQNALSALATAQQDIVQALEFLSRSST